MGEAPGCTIKRLMLAECGACRYACMHGSRRGLQLQLTAVGRRRRGCGVAAAPQSPVDAARHGRDWPPAHAVVFRLSVHHGACISSTPGSAGADYGY